MSKLRAFRSCACTIRHPRVAKSFTFCRALPIAPPSAHSHFCAGWPDGGARPATRLREGLPSNIGPARTWGIPTSSSWLLSGRAGCGRTPPGGDTWRGATPVFAAHPCVLNMLSVTPQSTRESKTEHVIRTYRMYEYYACDACFMPCRVRHSAQYGTSAA